MSASSNFAKFDELIHAPSSLADLCQLGHAATGRLRPVARFAWSCGFDAEQPPHGVDRCKVRLS